MTDNFTMWKLGSGLPLDGAEVTIKSAEFTYDQQYSADAVVLRLVFGLQDGSEGVQLYSCGSKWEPINGGAAVQHTSGKNQMFNDRTNIGRLIDSYLKARGDGDVQAGMVAAIADGVEPNKAEMWVGMQVTLGAIKYNTQTGKESTTFGVAEYHGRQGAVVKAAGVVAKVAAGKAKGKADGGVTDFDDHLGIKLFRVLKKLAQESDDHDTFMEAAFDLEETTSDDKAWNKATERIILNSDDDSLYATARL